MRILVTAFEPYDHWTQNSSWDCLVELLRSRGATPGVTTRRYPVDLGLMRERLYQDLSRGIDAVLHLGQAPGIGQIHLEAIALNVAGITRSQGEEFGPLVYDGPVAYRTEFPVGMWATDLKQSGIPAAVSYHAGTYLCNAIMYLSHHWFEERGIDARVGFIHLPLSDDQVAASGRMHPSLSLATMSKAIGLILDRVRGVQREFDFA